MELRKITDITDVEQFIKEASKLLSSNEQIDQIDIDADPLTKIPELPKKENTHE